MKNKNCNCYKKAIAKHPATMDFDCSIAEYVLNRIEAIMAECPNDPYTKERMLKMFYSNFGNPAKDGKYIVRRKGSEASPPLPDCLK